MNNLCKTLAFLFIFLLLMRSAGAQQPIMPLKPSELLAYAPQAPVSKDKKWEVVRSLANNDLIDWPICITIREFKYTPTPDPNHPNAPPKEPETTRIKITDTGYWPAFRNMFTNFEPGTFGPAQKKLIQSWPAIEMYADQDKPSNGRLFVLIKQRFLVEIATTNQPQSALEDWLKTIDLSKLASVPDDGARVIPNPVIIAFVDELNPKSMRSYPLYWTHSAATSKK
jgi:hypothetical protein